MAFDVTTEKPRRSRTSALRLRSKRVQGHGCRVARPEPSHVTAAIEYRELSSVVKFNRWFLAFVVGFASLWSILVLMAGYWFWVPIALAMVAVVWWAFRRTKRMAVVVQGDELVVTNMFVEHRLRRDAIGAFVIVPRLFGRRKGLEVRLKDFTSINCDVMGSPPGMGARPDLDSCQAELTRWLLVDRPARIERADRADRAEIE